MSATYKMPGVKEGIVLLVLLVLNLELQKYLLGFNKFLFFLS